MRTILVVIAYEVQKLEARKRQNSFSGEIKGVAVSFLHHSVTNYNSTDEWQ